MPRGISRPAPAVRTTPLAPTTGARPAATVTGASAADSFVPAGVTAAGLNPAVSPERQRATYAALFQLGRQLADQGKAPVIVLDHRLTALDDRPIIRKGLERLAQQYDIAELQDLDVALADGTLKFLPGYTEQASDHWRQAHPALVAKYPQAFGSPGSRINLGFMGFPVSDANATPGLSDLLARWKLETQGRGEIIFAGAGTGSVDQFISVYQRPASEGGGGIANPDVRFGAPSPSAQANERARLKATAFNQTHPNDEPVRLDHDSAGKAGWIEAIEAEPAADGRERVVAGFIDDRAHNRLAAQAASKLQDRMMAIKAVAPGLSFSQLDNGNEFQISTFAPNP